MKACRKKQSYPVELEPRLRPLGTNERFPSDGLDKISWEVSSHKVLGAGSRCRIHTLDMIRTETAESRVGDRKPFGSAHR